MDKQLNLNVFNFINKTFLTNDINFKDLNDFPNKATKFKFFEMQYPYFSSISHDRLAFSTDYGIFTANLANLFK